MSYGASVALQCAIYEHLRADPAISDLVGDAVFDAMPADAPSGPYIALGPESVTDAGDATAPGSRHDFIVSVLSGGGHQAGFRAVKLIASAVSDALEGGGMRLSRGRLAGMWFLRAKARRDKNGEARRVDLTFRARIDLG